MKSKNIYAVLAKFENESHLFWSSLSFYYCLVSFLVRSHLGLFLETDLDRQKKKKWHCERMQKCLLQKHHIFYNFHMD